MSRAGNHTRKNRRAGVGLEEALESARVLVCAGTGGVGKTTVAAALALRAARAGRRTLVLTIDPARRLADALGLEGLGAAPAPVVVTRADGETEQISLDAMMLDPKPTFDGLVERLAPDAATRARVLENRIYRHLSEALAGSAEYAALEQVREAVESGRYDLVVVDTPPASHALDFLSAPRRLREFLEGRFVQALVRPAMSASRFGFKVFGQSLHRMMGLVERIAGVGFLDDLSEFLSAVSALTDGFQAGTSRVEEILLGDDTRFVLVGGARSGQEPGTLEFLGALDELGAPLSAVVLNRIRPWPDEVDATDWLSSGDDEAIARDRARLADVLARASFEDGARDAAMLDEIVRDAATARRDAEETQRRIARRVAGRDVGFHLVAERDRDIDGLAGLQRIGEELFEGAPA
jgi:anion-transporting  ArsA/GET3 family ATPase